MCQKLCELNAAELRVPAYSLLQKEYHFCFTFKMHTIISLSGTYVFLTGMNAAVRAIVRMGIYVGCRVYLIKEVGVVFMW